MSETNVSPESLIPVSPESLSVGVPLPFAIYSPKGKLVAAKSYIFKNDNQIAGVKHSKPMRVGNEITLKAKVDSGSGTGSVPDSGSGSGSGSGSEHISKPRLTNFTEPARAQPTKASTESLGATDSIHALFELFDKLYKALNSTHAIVPKLLQKMESEIFRLLDDDEDAVIGIIHMTQTATQAEHCIFAAFLAAIYSRTLGYPERFSKLVTTSAICMNIGSIKLHQTLNTSGEQLTHELRTEIRKHSKASASTIQQSGIRHPTIINAILHHHERPDGKGYPAGLCSGEIPDEALIIGIVDTYLAMIGPRAYRQRMDPKEALKKVLFEGHKYDNDFYTTFIKAIGVYPAGTFHKLENGEVVVVTKRTANFATRPEVCRLIKSNGELIQSFNKQPLNSLNQNIKSPYAFNNKFRLKPSDLWS
jgi:HD-GYP domain-containing protein (c-di-GMP phosphodiesterase class II)